MTSIKPPERSPLRAGLQRLARHESRVVAAHRAALALRWRVALRMRNVGEMVQHQIDLLPLTQRRLIRDQRRRGALMRGLLRRLLSRPRQAVIAG